jgi:hypothetical protein
MDRRVSGVRRLRMSLTPEDLAKLLYEGYETAAVNRGWKTGKHVAWAFLPDEHKAVWRDATVILEKLVREDEQAKSEGTNTIQSDLQEIMKELGISTHARSYSSHEVVQRDILPKIRSMKSTLVAIRYVFSRYF